MNKALFLDLDGTIIEPISGVPFSENKDGWKFKEGILNKIKEYYNQDYYICIVTNQEGIGQGKIKPLEFTTMMYEVLNNIEAFIANQFPSEPTNFNNRVKLYVANHAEHKGLKPNPLFANLAKDELHLNLEECLMVGDSTGLVRNEFLFTISVPLDIFLANLEKDKKRILEASPTDKIQQFAVNTVQLHFMKFPTKEAKEEYVKAYEETYTLKPQEDGTINVYINNYDLSDSDKIFAQNSGIPYMDIEEFLK